MEAAQLPLPTIVFHGDRDHTVHPVNGDQVIAQSKAAAKLHLTINRGQSAGGINYTQTIQADGSGRRSWSSGYCMERIMPGRVGVPQGLTPTPVDPMQAVEMLRFFRENPRGPI